MATTRCSISVLGYGPCNGGEIGEGKVGFALSSGKVMTKWSMIDRDHIHVLDACLKIKDTVPYLDCGEDDSELKSFRGFSFYVPKGAVTKIETNTDLLGRISFSTARHVFSFQLDVCHWPKYQITIEKK